MRALAVGADEEIADFAFLERLRQQYAFSFVVDSLPAPFEGPALFMTGRQDIWCGYGEAFAGD